MLNRQQLIAHLTLVGWEPWIDTGPLQYTLAQPACYYVIVDPQRGRQVWVDTVSGTVSSGGWSREGELSSRETRPISWAAIDDKWLFMLWGYLEGGGAMNRQQMEAHLALLGWAPVQKFDYQRWATFLLTPDKGRVVWVTAGTVYVIPRVSPLEEFTAGSWQDWQPSELEAVLRRCEEVWP